MRWARITIGSLWIVVVWRLPRFLRPHISCRCLNFQCECEKCRLSQFETWGVTNCFSRELLRIIDRPMACNRTSFTAFTRRGGNRSEEHTSELQSHVNLVCRL